MKFIVKHTWPTSKGETTIDLDSLEDLLDFALETNEDIIILNHNGEDGHWELEIYDNYRE